ncbi:transcriptional regulator [Saccharothrix xinjiangensis]|uniref:Tol-pal system YbgF family protein n=1 Tax=Saccharothrix xinjiangensis TaxID=204798 RepID=A0ABV9Y460_9PSEU
MTTDSADRGDRGGPARIGTTDVRRLESATRVLREQDYRDGGGSCRTAVRSQVAHGRRLLRAQAREAVRDRLLVALADLHNLAGWVAFDTGHPRAARTHYRSALTLLDGHAQQDLVANVHYRIGRIHLHHRDHTGALREFGHALAAAERVGSSRTAAIVFANQAWAHALRGSRVEALTLLVRAEDRLASAAGSAAPSWAGFFDPTDLQAMIGVVHAELAVRGDRTSLRVAVPALTAAVEGYGASMRRSAAFCLTALALGHVLDGDPVAGAGTGGRALEAARELTSTRVADRMRPLLEHCARRRHAALADLAERLRPFVTRRHGRPGVGRPPARDR